jgi:hypothetical protein
VVYLDNVRFDGLTLEDDSAESTDGNVFFYDEDASTPVAPTNPPDGTRAFDGNGSTGGAAVTTDDPSASAQNATPAPANNNPPIIIGKNEHSINIFNNTGADTSVNVFVEPNKFLVYVDPSGQEIPVNNFNGDFQIYFNKHIASGTRLPLTFRAILPAGYAASLTKEQVQLLQAKVRVEELSSSGQRTLSTNYHYEMFYLADLADADPDDGVLDFGATRVDGTRNLHLDNPDNVTVSITSSANDQFVALPGNAGFQLLPDAVPSNNAPITGTAKFTFNGHDIGTVKLRANIVDNEVFNVPLDRIKQKLKDLLNDITTGTFDIDPEAKNDPIKRAEYTTFVSTFTAPGPLTLDQRLDEFGNGLLAGMQLIYHDVNSALTIQEGDNPNLRIDDALSLGEPRDGATYTTSEDFDYKTFGTTNTILQLPAQRVPNDFTNRSVRTDLSPASLAFRLERLFNTAPNNTRITLIYDADVREVGNTLTTPGEFGSHFGWILAHELGHELGLFDEYIYTGNTQKAAYANWQPPAGVDFMSDNQNFRVTDQQKLLLALALHDPSLTDKFFGFDPASAANPPLNVFRALAYTRELDDLDAYNRRSGTPSAFEITGGASNSNLVSGDETLAGAVRATGVVSADEALAGKVRPAGATTVSGDEELSGKVRAKSVAAQIGANSTLINGDFSNSNPSDSSFGWSARGNVLVNAAGQGVLGEGGNVFAGLSQTFTVPAGATRLRFTLSGVNFTDNGAASAPDAFEVALLNADTLTPAVGVATSLDGTDALLNIQSDGKTYFAPSVSIGGLTASGQTLSFNSPLFVDIDVSGIAAGTSLKLYFDLLGLGLDGSTIAIDDVTLTGTALPPTLVFQLDPATDSGVKGDNLTNFKPVRLTGTTDPLQTVLLDIDGDGFDDGSATADATGHFSFDTVVLAEGANALRMQATNEAGSTIASGAVTLDTRSPTILPPAVINSGQTQRSRIDRIEFDLSEDLAATLLAGDLRLVRNGSEMTPLTGVLLSFDHTSHHMTIDLRNVALADGDYELQVMPGGVADFAGNTLDVDGDNAGDAGTGKFFSVGFFKLTGDANADRVVNALDMLVVRKALNATAGQTGFDVNADLAGLGDGTVNATDMAVVTSNLTHTVQPLAPAKLTVLESSGVANDAAINFGAGPSQPIDVTLRNDGQKSLTIASLQIVGADAGAFSFDVVGELSGTTGLTLLPGQSAILRISFSPSSGTLQSQAVLRFWHNDSTSASPFSLTLTGQAAVAPAVHFITADEELVNVRPATTSNTSTVTAPASLAPVITPRVVTTPAKPALAKPRAITERPAPVAQPSRPVAPPAKPQAILTARLVAKSSSVTPPNRLFATGKEKRNVSSVSELLRSDSQPRSKAPAAPVQAHSAQPFNAARRIRIAPGSHLV